MKLKELMGSGHRIMLITLPFLVIGLILNLLFIPKKVLGINTLGLGAIGAAYSTLISMSVGAVLFRLCAYRITRSKPNLRILIHLIAALMMGIILQRIVRITLSISWYHLVLFGFIGIGLYAIILAIFREFTLKDLNLFLKILNPIQLMKYAKHEMQSGSTKHDILYEGEINTPPL